MRARGPVVSRRRFLAGSAAVLPLAYLSGCAGLGRIPPGSAGTPFSLGVASGEPAPDGFVIWTRLAPEPLAGGGMPDAPFEVAWTVARDPGFRDVAARGSVRAVPQDAHSVHVAVNGLEPARPYWYRFVADGESSPAGRTRTAPAPGAAVERLRFAFASCQQYEHAYYAAHRHMAEDDLDLVAFLGDYIYELSWGRNRVRQHGSGTCMTLADYRNRYALYKRDPDLQASHAALPWLVTWDDHEVANDYAGEVPEREVPGQDFRDRRAAGYKAFWEHMPLHPDMRPSGPAMRIYRTVDYGRLARFAVLDDRQYRDREVCPKPGRTGGSNVVVDLACPDRLDQHRTLLGAAQERWLADRLDGSPALWNVVAQQTLMAQLDRVGGSARGFWTDGWDGYPAARRRLLERFAGGRVSNPLVIGGDVHATYVADLRLDFDDPRSPVVASELCGTPIASQGPSRAQTEQQVAENPHVKFADGRTKGYMRVTLTPEGATAELRGLDDPLRADSGIATRLTAHIPAGRPGPVLA